MLSKAILFAFLVMSHRGVPVRADDCPAVGFVPAGTYSAGLLPACIVAADLNRDGQLDLAVANEFSGTISVLLGSGTGIFATAVDYPAEQSPSAVTVGDFNRDGKPDLAVANAGSASVAVLLGNGDGTFQSLVSNLVGDNPRAVAVGDFNLDMNPDLAVANRATSDVSVLLGNGDGTFQTADSHLAGIDPLAVVVGDFNRDNSPDLVIANSALFDDPPSISVLLGRGNGLFRNAVDYAAGLSPRSLGVGDFNQDGVLDLAAASFGEFVENGFTNGSVLVLLGNADGTFRTAVTYRAGEGPASVAVADLDKDGHLDLAVANSRSRNISVLPGNGDGTFDAPTDYAAGFNPRCVTAGDFDGDGKLDLTVANDSGVLLLLQTCLTNAELAIMLVDNPDPVGAGNNLTYTLIATNAGPAPAPDAILTDVLPQGVNFISATTTRGSCVHSGGIVTCNLNGLASTGSATIVITVSPTLTGNITNSAAITSVVTTDPIATNNMAVAVTRVLPVVSITALDSTASEAGLDPGAFRINRTGGTLGSLVVNYTVAGTADNGLDYTAVSSSATIASGSSSVTIAVNPVDELAVEPTETVALTLVPNAAYAINQASNSAVVSILDDDDYWLSITDVAVLERNGGPTNAVFTVSLSYPNALPITVGFFTSNGTAVAGSDYVSTNGTLIFAPGSTNQTVTVPVLGDLLNEANETFYVTLINPTNAVLADAQGAGTITNDDPLPSLSIADVVVTEGNGSATIATFNVNLSALSGQTVTLSFATTDGTAQGGADYTATNGALTFPPGATTRTIQVMVSGDLLNEIDETFLVNLSNPVNATLAGSQATGTIGNDDPLPSLSIGDVVVTEGNSGSTDAVLAVRLSALSGQTVNVGYASANGSANSGSDYSATNGTLIFPPGVVEQTLRIKVNGDRLNEIDETFLVNLSNPVNSTIADSQATGTIQNDDPLPSLSIADVIVTEGNSGNTNAVFRVSLSAPSGQLVAVNFASVDGTATAVEDYLSASGTLTFAPGTTNESVVIRVVGETLNEANETFSVTLANPTNAVISDATAIATISNDDPLPSLSIADTTVTEGDIGTLNAIFTVNLSAVSGQKVSVNFASTDGTARTGSDYIARSGTLTFDLGSTSQSIAVPVIGDTLNEINETFSVMLVSPTNAVINDGVGMGTIDNNDPLPGLAINDAIVTEGNSGTTDALFTVSLSAISGQTVTVNYASLNGTADAGADYVATTGTLTFPPGTSAQPLRLTVNGDLSNEFDETFSIILSGPGNAILADNQGTGTITNDDPPPSLSIADAAVVEGNDGSTNAIFVVTLSAPSGKPVSINYATERGTVVGNDFVSASGLLLFSPGQTQLSLSVQVNGDTRVEANETFFVNLSNPTNATLAGSQAVGTILNDDGVPAITIADVNISEGNAGTVSASFTVRLSTTHNQTVTVGYGTADGTASAGIDYLATNGVLSFASGIITQTITVGVIGDQLDEIDETFFVNLSTATNAFVSDGQGAGRILDDDPLNFLISTDRLSLVEGGTNSFSVRLGSPPPVSVVIRTARNSGDPDLSVSGADLTFNAANWNVPQPVTIRADEDADTIDDNATFMVSADTLPSQIVSVTGLDNDLEYFVRCPGDSVVFSAATSGAGPFVFAWSKDGLALGGQTNSALIISNSMSSDAGEYSVAITSASYSVTRIGTLEVNSATSATPLGSLTNCPGTTAVFSPIVNGTGPFTFLWRKNGIVLEGRTSSSLEIGNVQPADFGSYSVEVTGRCGSVISTGELMPGDGESCSVRISFIRMVGNDVIVGFSSILNQQYRLEWIDDLLGDTWGTVIDAVDGTGGTIEVTDIGGIGHPSRFYRVVRSPNPISPAP